MRLQVALLALLATAADARRPKPLYPRQGLNLTDVVEDVVEGVLPDASVDVSAQVTGDSVGVSAEVSVGAVGVGAQVSADVAGLNIGADVDINLYGCNRCPRVTVTQNVTLPPVTVTVTSTTTTSTTTTTTTSTTTSTTTTETSSTTTTTTTSTTTTTTTTTTEPTTTTTTTTTTEPTTTTTTTTTTETSSTTEETTTSTTTTTTTTTTSFITTTVSTTATVTTSFSTTITINNSITITSFVTTEILVPTTIVTTLTLPEPPPVTVPGPTVTATVDGAPTTVVVTETEPGQVITTTIDGTPTTITVTQTQSGSTTTITVVATCPVPTPTLGATLDPESDLTWGCPPGKICQPDKPQGCNIWADSPDDEFTCQPSQCKDAPAPKKPQWPPNEIAYYEPTEGYFNLDPRAFGLPYDIFEAPVVTTKTVHGQGTVISSGNYVSQTSLSHYPPESDAAPAPTPDPYPAKQRYARELFKMWNNLHFLSKRDETIVPAICYDDCNNCYLEAERVGKSPSLCQPESVFQQSWTACQECIADNAQFSKDEVMKHYIAPKFEQFLGYCSAHNAEPAVTTTGAETQVNNPPTVVTDSQAAGNTNTGPVPIGPSTTGGPGRPTTTRPPTSSTTFAQVGPNAAAKVAPALYTILAPLMALLMI